ncbi:hypothetical protein FZ103_11125 [Streptomonospora sp. PA3]|uniref:hypothetical protein n=1 Tax=Streptomonospora sp. PA3 TaxID=2607326 RepID=UPI0012DD3B3D|nr:hypothetical protein [Streptomonospora sp. PA3]MUL41718.1 hypothetical protein [Streptomonospora sp. PA3]
MPAATTFANRQATADLRGPARVPGTPDGVGDPDSVDAAQNAELAALIRRLADTRPEIFSEWNPRRAAPPPAAQRSQTPPPSPAEPPRAAGGGAAPEPAPSSGCPHGCRHALPPRAFQPGPLHTPPRPPLQGGEPVAPGWMQALWHLCATIGAATVALGATAALAHVLPVPP